MTLPEQDPDYRTIEFDMALDDHNAGRLSIDGLRAVYADLFVLNKEEDPPSQSGPSAS